MSQRELFRADGLPVLQNRVFEDRAAALASPRGDLRLVQELDSGLVHNAAFDPGLLVYDENYQNEQAVSPVFQQHLHSVEALLRPHFKDKALIEVGCGKAWFLHLLRRAGYRITGIDPAYEGGDPDIVKAPFEVGLGLSAEGIVLRHVLEHMQQPAEFLASIAQANGGRGLIYIEVPCFDWICARRAWFDLFYEHVNYFRLADFHRLFGQVVESGHSFGGQYLYVLAELSSLRVPRSQGEAALDFPADFLAGVTRAAERARERPATVWGGSSKGVIFSIYLQRAGAEVARVIDLNPAKQGRHLAVSGLRVDSPDAAIATMRDGDDVFVMNSNYLPEIAAMTARRFNYLPVDHHEL